MTSAVTRPRWKGIAIVAAQIVLSIVAGFFLMIPLAMAFDALYWSTYNTWALAHGGFGAAWPALAIFSFALLGLVKWFYRFRDAYLFAAGALFGLALQGLLWMPEPPDFAMASQGLIVGACIDSALLCYFAQRRFPLALAIAFPSFDFGWLFIIFPHLEDREAWEYVGVILGDTLPLAIAPFVGACLADLARYFTAPGATARTGGKS